MHHSSHCQPLLLLCFYKSPRNLLLTIHKKHDSVQNNHRESPDLPLLTSSSHIALWSSVGKSINGCLTLAGILCTHSCSLAAPASCQHQLQIFFYCRAGSCLHVSLLQPALHRDISQVLARELKEIPAGRGDPLPG